MAAVPTGGGVLSREQILIAMERVRSIDEQLAILADNDYKPAPNPTTGG